MEIKENVMLLGILEKDAEPILNQEKELGCLLTVKSKSRTHKVEVFSSLLPVLYKKALKNTRVLVPAWKDKEKFCASIVYPA
ncbi:MAG: hypothetical protein Q4P16_04070 [Spirochaetales bacterium]|nr:hypothetical protein [Spirochaetales bacterium]